MNSLEHNVKKIIEMVIDFRIKNQNITNPFINDAENIEIGSRYKYLGYTIHNQLKGSYITNIVAKICNQGLRFLHISNNVPLCWWQLRWT